jgi:hypothetical protein
VWLLDSNGLGSLVSKRLDRPRLCSPDETQESPATEVERISSLRRRLSVIKKELRVSEPPFELPPTDVEARCLAAGQSRPGA